MKKYILFLLSAILCFGLASCEEKKATPSVSEQSSQQRQESSSGNTETLKTGERKAKIIIDGQEFDVTLYDTPAANALYDMLPLELNFEDFNNIEKIAYMDCELPIQGEPNEFDPDVGDLCLYAPWGNLSIFYKDFRNSNGLISLGHIDSGMDVISNINEDFLVLLEKSE